MTKFTYKYRTLKGRPITIKDKKHRAIKAVHLGLCNDIYAYESPIDATSWINIVKEAISVEDGLIEISPTSAGYLAHYTIVSSAAAKGYSIKVVCNIKTDIYDLIDDTTWDIGTGEFFIIDGNVIYSKDEVPEGYAIVKNVDNVEGLLRVSDEVFISRQSISVIKATSLNISGSSSIILSGTYTYTTTYIPNNATVSLTYSTSDSNLNINDSGVLTVPEGYYNNIVVTVTDSISGLSSSMNVSVDSRVMLSNLKIYGNTYITSGGTYTYTVTYNEPKPSTYKNLVYSCSDSSLTIDSSGKLTIPNKSTTKNIVVTVTDTISGLSDSIDVNINIEDIVATSLSLTGSTSIKSSGTYTYTTTYEPSNAVVSLTYSTSDSSLSINDSGVLTVPEGYYGNSVRITVSDSKSGLTASKNVSIDTRIPLQGLHLNGSSTIELAGDYYYTTSWDVNSNPDSYKFFTWITSDPDLVIVSDGSNGAILTIPDYYDNQYSVDVTVTENYSGETATITLTPPIYGRVKVSNMKISGPLNITSSNVSYGYSLSYTDPFPTDYYSFHWGFMTPNSNLTLTQATDGKSCTILVNTAGYYSEDGVTLYVYDNAGGIETEKVTYLIQVDTRVKLSNLSISGNSSITSAGTYTYTATYTDPVPSTYKNLVYSCSDSSLTIDSSSGNLTVPENYNDSITVTVTDTISGLSSSMNVSISTATDDSLKFTALAANSNISFQSKSGSNFNNIEVYYNLNNTGWTSYTLGDSITLTNIGDYVKFKNTTNVLSDTTVNILTDESAFKENNTNYYYFSSSADTTSLSVSGKIISLINDSSLTKYCFRYLFDENKYISDISELKFPDTTIEGCYFRMFYECYGIKSTPELTSTSLSDCCYYGMFCNSGITNITYILPSTVLSQYCYYDMFCGCVSLTSVRKDLLPATSLNNSENEGAIYCYGEMFNNCPKLVNTPNLPATTLSTGCYYAMFGDCKKLTDITTLPATTIFQSSYEMMFRGCTSLTEAPTLSATTLNVSCYRGMFRECTSLTEAPALPATNLSSNCYYWMFYGCTSLIEAPTLSATSLAYGCYEYMFRGCTSLTEAPALPATTLKTYCYLGMFYGCTSLTVAPILPATSGGAYSYNYLFYGCTNLSEITVYSSDLSNYYSRSWVDGVASTGTFYNLSGTDISESGVNGIPSGWTVLTSK